MCVKPGYFPSEIYKDRKWEVRKIEKQLDMMYRSWNKENGKKIGWYYNSFQERLITGKHVKQIPIHRELRWFLVGQVDEAVTCEQNIG